MLLQLKGERRLSYITAMHLKHLRHIMTKREKIRIYHP
jgi:hypothetical protein